MTVLLSGGTGFVGSALHQDLLRLGHSVGRLVRSHPPSPFGSPGRADDLTKREPTSCSSIVPVDFFQVSDLARAFHGAEAIVHLVGIISEYGTQTFEAVHTELTRRMVTAARQAGVRRFVHMSALGTRPSARSRYHQTKWEAESAVRESGLDWTIFRPSMIYGARDGFTRLFARIARISPVVPVFGPGTHLLQPIAVEQVARAFAAALDTPESVGGTFDLCGPERLDMNTLLRQIVAATGRRRHLLHIPWGVAMAQAAVLKVLFAKVLRRPPPLNRDQLLMLQEDNIGEGDRADRLFQLTHPPFASAIASYLTPGTARREATPGVG